MYNVLNIRLLQIYLKYARLICHLYPYLPKVWTDESDRRLYQISTPSATDAAVVGDDPMSTLPSSFSKAAACNSSPVLSETAELHRILDILSCDGTMIITSKKNITGKYIMYVSRIQFSNFKSVVNT